jgi:hypothetical protein
LIRPIAASNNLITPKRSTNSVTATIPETVLSTDPPRRSAPTVATVESRVRCPPDRCSLTRDDQAFDSTIIPGQQDTYRLDPRVTPDRKATGGIGSEPKASELSPAVSLTGK